MERMKSGKRFTGGSGFSKIAIRTMSMFRMIYGFFILKLKEGSMVHRSTKYAEEKVLPLNILVALLNSHNFCLQSAVSQLETQLFKKENNE